MWWALLAQAGLGMMQQAQQNAQSQKEIRRINAAAEKANVETVKNLAQAISSVNVQNSYMRVEAARQLRDAEVAAYAASGTAGANAAAAGAKGASVDAVLMDIERELNESKSNTESNLELQQYNLTNRIKQLSTQAKGAMLGLQSPTAMDGNVFVAGLTSAAGSYMNNFTQYGATTNGMWSSVRGGVGTAFGKIKTSITNRFGG